MTDAIMGSIGVPEGRLACQAGRLVIQTAKVEFEQPGAIATVLSNSDAGPLADEEHRLRERLDEIEAIRRERRGA